MKKVKVTILLENEEQAGDARGVIRHAIAIEGEDIRDVILSELNAGIDSFRERFLDEFIVANKNQ